MFDNDQAAYQDYFERLLPALTPRATEENGDRVALVQCPQAQPPFLLDRHDS